MQGLQLRHTAPEIRIFVGTDALESIPRELDRLKSIRAVALCGASLGGNTRLMDRLSGVLGDRFAGVFPHVAAHSPRETVEAAAAFLADHRADAVIALGGGSAVVTSRAAAILLAEDRPFDELATQRRGDGTLHSPRLESPKLPQLVVPSTPTTAYAKAGSAVRDTAAGKRLALFDPKTSARALFFAPEVAATAPNHLVQASGLTAIAMAIEGLSEVREDPIADALLIGGLRSLCTWLPVAHADWEDTDARMRLMLGSFLVGRGSNHKGGGVAQALSHELGPANNEPNGLIHAILVFRMLETDTETTKPENTAAEAVLDQRRAANDLRTLFAHLGLSTRLRDVGVAKSTFSVAVAATMVDWVAGAGAHRTPDDLHALLDAAW